MVKVANNEEKEVPLKIKKNYAQTESDSENNNPFGFMSPQDSAMGVTDIDEQKAMSELVKYAFNFPSDRIWSWTRLRRREIPLIARSFTKMLVKNPNRPKNKDGSIKSAMQLYYEFIAWLRLAEEGALRSEAMQGLKVKTEEPESSNPWSDQR